MKTALSFFGLFLGGLSPVMAGGGALNVRQGTHLWLIIIGTLVTVYLLDVTIRHGRRKRQAIRQQDFTVREYLTKQLRNRIKRWSEWWRGWALSGIRQR